MVGSEKIMTSNEEWLKSLKVGDKVYYICGDIVGTKTVERLTPTGRVILKGKSGQFINGRHRIDAYNSERISELTPELEKEFRDRLRLKKIKAYDWTKSDHDTICAVYKILYWTE